MTSVLLSILACIGIVGVIMITPDSLLKEWKAGYKDNVKTLLEGIKDKQARMTLTAELYAKLSTEEGAVSLSLC